MAKPPPRPKNSIAIKELETILQFDYGISDPQINEEIALMIDNHLSKTKRFQLISFNIKDFAIRHPLIIISIFNCIAIYFLYSQIQKDITLLGFIGIMCIGMQPIILLAGMVDSIIRFTEYKKEYLKDK